MTDKNTMRFAFQRLSPCSRDVIVIRPFEDMPLEHYEIVAKQAQELAAEFNCLALIASPDVGLEHFSEETMNKNGWYKIENIPKEFKH